MVALKKPQVLADETIEDLQERLEFLEETVKAMKQRINTLLRRDGLTRYVMPILETPRNQRKEA